MTHELTRTQRIVSWAIARTQWIWLHHLENWLIARQLHALRVGAQAAE